MRVLMRRDEIVIRQMKDEGGIIIEQIDGYGETHAIHIPFDSVDFFLEQLNEVCAEPMGPIGDANAE